MYKLFVFSCVAFFLYCSALIGQTPEPDASVLLQAGDQFFQQGNFTEAQIKYEQALKILEKTNNEEGMASTSFKLGTAYRKVGKYEEARRLLNRAMKLHKDLQDRKAVGWDLTELAYVARKQSRYEEALQLSNQALEIHEEFGNRKGVVDTYINIAGVYQFQGEHKKALEYYGRSMSIATEMGDKDRQVRVLMELGSVHWRMGNLEMALDYYYQKALPLAEEIGNKQGQAKILGNIALIHWNRGQLNEALDYVNRSQVLAEQLKDQQSIAINYFNAGALYRDLGEYGTSLESLQKSLVISEEIGDRGLTQASMDALGQLHADMGENDIALDFMQKAAKIAEEIGEKRSLAYDLKSIASLYANQKKFPDALISYRKALALYEELKEKRGIALTLNELADTYVALKNDKEALPNYEKALAIAAEMKSDLIMQDSYRGKGWIHFSRKEMPQAEECFSKSIDLAREIERPDSIWKGLYGKSLVHRETGKSAEALLLMKEAVDIIEKARSEVQLAELRASYLEQKLDVYEDLIRLLVKTSNFAEAFEYVQRAKARSFLDMLAEAKIDPEGKLDATFIERKKKLFKQLAEVQRKIQGESENDSVDRTKIHQLAKKRNELEYEFNNLKLEIRKQDPRLSDLQYPRPLGLQQVQALLDDRSAMLEYFLGRVESFLFVITSHGVRVHTVPPEKKLNGLVNDIRNALLKPEPVWEVSEGSHTTYVQRASELYKELISPAEPDLSRVKELVIAPDGVLNYLPFESLLRRKVADRDFSNLPYMGLDFELQYVPSGTVLAALKADDDLPAANQRQKEFLAFADPTTPPPKAAAGLRETTILPLPNARLEVEEIARLFPRDQVAIFKGQDASEQNVKKLRLDQYRRVHFASHGILDQEHPEFSSILLKGSEGGEDGYLMMREVFDLSLNADLVVLSACKTGLGQQIRGEGIMGLSRAFLSAGTATVLVSLWNVPDKSTSVFMTSFYQALVKKGMRKAAALKRARQELIQSGKFSHPYYWAPFVLIGKP